jgi:hypothetical protein
MYEILGEDANGDDWFAAADDPAVADAFVKQFREEGLTNVRVAKIDPSRRDVRSTLLSAPLA